ncbi:MAG: Ribose-5-phosphate isomerase B [Parcubacteria group bacterium GW2011_GWF2_39_8b]|nr:MAG: Ribose-5-phosphate isomerase B [Parcubacteria group bacterium GW2011_GWF2_39_8b]KKR45909.1 MAG: Ribose-5-phosphate isomerase B [Parcubacteria group bacterium GW2011_GWA2_40_14]OHA97085.1 MAG: ribose-5-phosphate isomerase [Candidatus Zambryskibacteria bacterium RIFCSPHIGHO2_02_FULL_39_82]OHB07558.1 MAG: ribose-5-phosphate isomerase [Candidatus Zambryskibacteria bacterium RIFCSPLOWO2_02_39_10]OHB11582.1 MAG: ribose-5-phosphate isomerase [Candidatus Zambryskibacteria bacterium RIFCSPLOWO2_
MKLYIGSDHAGFEMKRELITFLSESGFDVVDCGPNVYDPEDDYPDYVSVVAKNISEDVSKDIESFGIVIGKSGQGEAMVANRFPNVRCTVFYGGSKHVLMLSREHNNANMLSLGANFLTNVEARQAIELWLNTKFSGDARHVRRIRKIENIKI